jgi:hypothetical protein
MVTLSQLTAAPDFLEDPGATRIIIATTSFTEAPGLVIALEWLLSAPQIPTGKVPALRFEGSRPYQVAQLIQFEWRREAGGVVIATELAIVLCKKETE